MAAADSPSNRIEWGLKPRMIDEGKNRGVGVDTLGGKGKVGYFPRRAEWGEGERNQGTKFLSCF